VSSFIVRSTAYLPASQALWSFFELLALNLKFILFPNDLVLLRYVKNEKSILSTTSVFSEIGVASQKPITSPKYGAYDYS